MPPNTPPVWSCSMRPLLYDRSHRFSFASRAAAADCSLSAEPSEILRGYDAPDNFERSTNEGLVSLVSVPNGDLMSGLPATQTRPTSGDYPIPSLYSCPIPAHTPLVAVIVLVPLFGAATYLLAKPLRKRVLIRLVVDQLATVLPFRAYQRFHLQRWLAPPA